MCGSVAADPLGETLAHLSGAGLQCLVFGGWAEELAGLRPAGPHTDIDLLLPADNFGALERAMAGSNGFHEICAKRFAHKRAWIGAAGVMVEFLLVREDEDGPSTCFWGDRPFHWLSPLSDRAVRFAHGPVGVTSRANLTRYRQHHHSLEPWRWRAPESLVG